jgi:flagellar biogenesis protein FliO
MAMTNSEPKNVSSPDPEWINKDKIEEQSDSGGGAGRSAWRSIGALLFVVGALVSVQVLLKRRAVGRAMAPGQPLKMVSRLRVAPRQDVVIVEWEGEQLLLGVSQSSIQPLHRRPGDLVEQGAVGGGVHVQ